MRPERSRKSRPSMSRECNHTLFLAPATTGDDSPENQRLRSRCDSRFSCPLVAPGRGGPWGENTPFHGRCCLDTRHDKLLVKLHVPPDIHVDENMAWSRHPAIYLREKRDGARRCVRACGRLMHGGRRGRGGQSTASATTAPPNGPFCGEAPSFAIGPKHDAIESSFCVAYISSV